MLWGQRQWWWQDLIVGLAPAAGLGNHHKAGRPGRLLNSEHVFHFSSFPQSCSSDFHYGVSNQGLRSEKPDVLMLVYLASGLIRKRCTGPWPFPGVWMEWRTFLLLKQGCSKGAQRVLKHPFPSLLFHSKQLKRKQNFHNKNVCNPCGQDDFRCYSRCLIMICGHDMI